MDSFTPEKLAEITVRLSDIINLSPLDNTNRDYNYFYQEYFLVNNKIKLLKQLSIEIADIILQIRPHLTHKNKEIQSIFYKSYLKMEILQKDVLVNEAILNKRKEDVINMFNIVFEQREFSHE